MTLRGINIFHIREERIVEPWVRLDEVGVLRQRGIAPAPA